MFVMVAVKTIVKVSAALLILKYQSTILVVELNVKNVVLPASDPVTDICKLCHQ